jgi:hypothetical protein
MEIRAAVRRHGHELCSQALRVYLNRLPIDPVVCRSGSDQISCQQRGLYG